MVSTWRLLLTPSESYPVHKLSPSIHWHTYTFHWSCYRWLRSDTSSAADSLLHKTQQDMLGKRETQIQKHLVTSYLPVI